MFAFSTSRPQLDEKLAARVRPVSLGLTRTLPLDEPWASLVPGGGLRRGATVSVTAPAGGGGLSLALTLLTAASARGHWAAVVGVEDPGVVAMAELGLDLRRVLFVPRPRGVWAESAADLLDGVDLVIVRPPGRAALTPARRLADRVRERGAVLIVLNEPRVPWPLPADLSLDVVSSSWSASSRLDERQLDVVVRGRGATRPATVRLALPPR